jgi:hypothetical protein
MQPAGEHGKGTGVESAKSTRGISHFHIHPIIISNPISHTPVIPMMGVVKQKIILDKYDFSKL